MRYVSFLGLIALVLIAYLLSYHRKEIKFRTVAWGLGLQFLFAVIILQESYWSFVGMVVLGLLLVAYVFRERILAGARPFVTLLGIVAVALAAGALAYFLAGWLPFGLVLAVLALFLLVNAAWLRRRELQLLGAAAFFIVLVAGLIEGRLYGQVIFKSFSDGVAYFLDLSFYGASFLFGNLVDQRYFFPEGGTWPGFGFQFAFKVLPTIIFFGAFMSILYYLGVMQRVIVAMARFMRWTMGTSGAETLSCSANVFVGQTEAPLLIKPFLDDMTPSELLTIMVGGFATIAGGVLAGYISMGVSAGHLIAASVMSAPAALVIGKIIYPEVLVSKTAGEVEMPEVGKAENLLDAASTGITDGLKLAVNVGAMLIGFIALIAVLDVILSWLDGLIDGRLLQGALYSYQEQSGLSPVRGEYAGIFPGSLKTFFGSVLKPLAFLMGVSWEYADEVGNLLGIKLSLNEFVAYGTLGSYIQNGALDERAETIATYALCGFANFSSIGIQIGGISAIAPGRRRDLTKIALKAMFGGAIASWITATIAGMLL